MSEQPKEQKDENKLSEKFVTPDKNAIIVRRKKKPVKKDEQKKGKA